MCALVYSLYFHSISLVLGLVFEKPETIVFNGVKHLQDILKTNTHNYDVMRLVDTQIRIHAHMMMLMMMAKKKKKKCHNLS